MNEAKREHYEAILPEVTKQASERERRAEEAERETVKLKKVEYMAAHIGEVQSGIISSITGWGMYVELDNTVEGLVHVMNMTDDHYDYVKECHEMVGVHTGITYELGQRIFVRVIGTDKVLRTIDFEIANEGDIENGKDEWETDRQ